MGSYNETCSLTNLPINYGDKVIVFLAASGVPTSGNVSYAFSKGKFALIPLSLPIQGTYNSYGCIENPEAAEGYKLSALFLNILENQKTIIRTSDKMDYLTAADRKSLMFVDPYTRECHFVNLIMIHAYAYKELITYYALRKTEVFNREIMSHVEIKNKDIVEEYMAKFGREILQFHKKGRLSDQNDCTGVRELLTIIARNVIVTENMLKLWQPSLYRLELLLSALSEGRMTLKTRIGAGSQDSSVFVQEKLSRITLKLAKDIKAANEE